MAMRKQSDKRRRDIEMLAVQVVQAQEHMTYEEIMAQEAQNIGIGCFRKLPKGMEDGEEE